jgi:hypothetical protein
VYRLHQRDLLPLRLAALHTLEERTLGERRIACQAASATSSRTTGATFAGDVSQAVAVAGLILNVANAPRGCVPADEGEVRPRARRKST